MSFAKKITIARPESEQKIAELARRLLIRADAIGVLPTPIEELCKIAQVELIADLPTEGFLRKFGVSATRLLRQALQKVRGVADLRERANYIPKSGSIPRDRFVQGHELGHQVLPWHQFDPAYLDNDESLRPGVRQLIEREANFFSAEILYQGAEFTLRARDFRPSLDAVFQLADDHGTSRQSTAWRFVEVQDEPVALLQFYPKGAIDDKGFRVLHSWQPVMSPRFAKQFSTVSFPEVLRSDHEWTAARTTLRMCSGTIRMLVDQEDVNFEWNSWWNNRCLLVLLRRRPALAVVRRLIAR
jgi:hypothetical protein